MKPQKIFVISDSIGETAELVARAAASQFNFDSKDIKRISYVTDKQAIDNIIEDAADYHSVIVYTLLSEELRLYLREKTIDADILSVDILGPVLSAFGEISGIQPRLEPGRLHKIDDGYFKKIEAIEFAVKFDDGKDPRGLSKADIVLVGVSRTSKTPISMYLANKSYKVANVPLVPEVPVPEELFNVPSKKIVGLTIDPDKLTAIRQTRLKVIGLPGQADYANIQRISDELEYAHQIMRKLRCPIINVSSKAIEETANEIIQKISKGDSL